MAAAVGVVLAAGAGTRFGMPKVLAAQGEWLRGAVEALARGGCSDVLVVLGAAVVDPPPPARAVPAPRWQEGLSASLRAGLAAAADTAAGYAVLHTVDTPDVGSDVVARVLDAARAAPAGIARARYGERPGHPVVVAREHWTAIVSEARGDAGAGPFLSRRDDVLLVDCEDLATGVDIDQNIDPV